MSAYTWVRKALDVSQLPRVKLNNIQDLPGAKRKAVRVGRGPGSGKGKTCGRGHKGQGQRNKAAIRVGFEGGQTPFYLRVPKRGFRNKNQTHYVPLNLNRVQYLIDSGRIDASQPVNMHTLQQSGAVGRIKHGVKLLATGSEWFESKVNIEVSQASRKAIETIQKVGGQITTAHYNSLGLRVLLKPWRFEDRLRPRRALPNKKLMAYYLNPENRGYLVVTEEGRERLRDGGMEGAYLGDDG
jgi:large subunit ribosomal protein L15